MLQGGWPGPGQGRLFSQMLKKTLQVMNIQLYVERKRVKGSRRSTRVTHMLPTAHTPPPTDRALMLATFCFWMPAAMRSGGMSGRYVASRGMVEVESPSPFNSPCLGCRHIEGSESVCRGLHSFTCSNCRVCPSALCGPRTA